MRPCLSTVALFTEPDRQALFVREADDYVIPPQAIRPYLIAALERGIDRESQQIAYEGQ
jgi:hypothetical protein